MALKQTINDIQPAQSGNKPASLNDQFLPKYLSLLFLEILYLMSQSLNQRQQVMFLNSLLAVQNHLILSVFQ